MLSNEVPISSDGIAWDSDVQDKFGPQLATNFNPPGSTRGGSTIYGPINEDERFIVWMRTAALSHFRKLWGIIQAPPEGPTLSGGEVISIDVLNRYNTYEFNGMKKVVLSTSSWIGGKNDFLGIAFLTVGIVSAFMGLSFFLLRWRSPRRLGDLSYLSWNNNAAMRTNIG